MNRRGIRNMKGPRMAKITNAFLEDAMTGSGRLPAWRTRAILMALALVSSLLMVPDGWRDARADETTNVTMLYHGSVGGKIAPCG